MNLLASYLKSGHSFLFLESPEEARACTFIKRSAEEAEFNVYEWNCVQGIRSIPSGNATPTAIPGTEDPLSMFDAFEKQLPDRSILLLLDFHLWTWTNEGSVPGGMMVRRIKQCAETGRQNSKTMIFVGVRSGLPPEIEKEATPVPFPLPTREELADVLRGAMTSAKLTKLDEFESVLDAAMGMTSLEAGDSFALSWVMKRKIDPMVVYNEKCAAIRKTDLLEVINSPETLDDLGGGDNLKEYTRSTAKLFTPEAKAYGFTRTPRGVILVGPSGCGKSLFSKIVSKVFGTMLVRMDIGKLKGGIVGESERRMRQAIKLIEAMGRVVVWVDEVEKGLSGVAKGSSSLDGGASAGQFDALLYSLQEGMKGAFFVLTSNNIMALPPEFIQRFQDVFYVDLPNDEEREDIWGIHIRKNGRDPKNYNLVKLAQLTKGYSGREIEKAWFGGQRLGFWEDKQVGMRHLEQSISEIVPTSRSNQSDIDKLKREVGARPANRIRNPIPAGTRKVLA